jgi:hypothetical protein
MEALVFRGCHWKILVLLMYGKNLSGSGMENKHLNQDDRSGDSKKEASGFLRPPPG